MVLPVLLVPHRRAEPRAGVALDLVLLQHRVPAALPPLVPLLHHERVALVPPPVRLPLVRRARVAVRAVAERPSR
jgi:hypothetical protein